MSTPPLSRRLRRVMLGLSIIGLGVAIYLTVVHYVGFSLLACGSAHGGASSCQTVQSSVWSELAGVPVAVLGLIGYVFIVASLLAPDREETRLATLGLTLIGFGFSAYLTYRELFSIHAICEWCVSSAVILTLLLIGSAVRFVLGGSPVPGIAASSDLSPNGASSQDPGGRRLARPRA